MNELKQKNNTVWVNVGEHLVVVCGPLQECEWYGSKRIVKTVQVGEDCKILMLA